MMSGGGPKNADRWVGAAAGDWDLGGDSTLTLLLMVINSSVLRPDSILRRAVAETPSDIDGAMLLVAGRTAEYRQISLPPN